MLRTIFIILALGLATVAQAEPISAREINTVRQATGLPALKASPILEQAAMAHAHYLTRYMPIGSGSAGSAHEQRKNSVDYTGYLAPERAAYFGYPHVQVLENISLGNESVKNSIEDLMSAIYHRFAFLAFDIDEIGAAHNDRHYVFNMGKRDLGKVCLQQPIEAELSQPISCLGKPMQQSAYQALCANLPREAKYRAPYSNRCENGALLRADFMQEMCKQPPKEAILKGAGRYFDACGNGTRIKASWMDTMCQSRREEVIYPYSGQVYQICEPQVEVHASWYQAFCSNLPAKQQSTDSGRYYQVCENDFKIRAEYYDELESKRLSNRPEAVLWPPEGARDIKPVFYDEDPHPTPDLPMTGYPISIQFNAAKVESISIMGFNLERQSKAGKTSWLALTEVREINHINDIHQKFSRHQFAWFPMQRLEWGTNYRYQIDALVNGVFQRFSAHFSTIDFEVPVYSVNGETSQVLATEDQFILYRAPDAYDEFPFSDVELRGNKRTKIEAKVIDPNTVELHIQGGRCAPVVLRTRLGEQINIQRCEKSGWRSLF